MLRPEDETTLRDAGIEDFDQLLHFAAEFIREHPIRTLGSEQSTLSDTERQLLKNGGALGLEQGVDQELIGRENFLRVASRYAQLVATALSTGEVAERLGVTCNRVRQLSDVGALYFIHTANDRVYPRWQFSDSETLPGLEKLLRSLPKETHPIAVESFMLTRHPDLYSDVMAVDLCPRDWLLLGHHPAMVNQMAMDL